DRRRLDRSVGGGRDDAAEPPGPGGSAVDIEYKPRQRLCVSLVVVGRARAFHAEHIDRYTGQAPLSESCLNIRRIHPTGDHCGWCRTLTVLLYPFSRARISASSRVSRQLPTTAKSSGSASSRSSTV